MPSNSLSQKMMQKNAAVKAVSSAIVPVGFGSWSLQSSKENYAGNIEPIVRVAEFPMVRRAFSKEEISIIALVDGFNEQYIFGRKDRGINTVADLKGKKLGIPGNTTAEFYLGRFLELHGMTMQDITLVDIVANESVAAIASGRVDGVVAWEPHTRQIRVQIIHEDDLKAVKPEAVNVIR